jgi:hypothetical protein
MARVAAAPVRNWARTILTEVGGDILEEVQLITADWTNR